MNFLKVVNFIKNLKLFKKRLNKTIFYEIIYIL